MAKRMNYNIFILVIFGLYVAYYRLFLSYSQNSIADYINIATILIFTFIAILLLGYRKDKLNQTKKSIIGITITEVLIFLAISYGLGVVTGYIHNTYYFDINLIELEPSAWDYKFSKIEAEWVIVTLTDDSVIAGFMGGLSFASSNEGERDIYINEVYKIDDDNNWKIQTDTNGILIKAENIKYIEFFKRKEKENEQQFKEKCSKKYIKSYKK